MKRGLVVVLLVLVLVAGCATTADSPVVRRNGIPMSAEELPFYLPYRDEIVAYVAERFGLSVEELFTVNPHLEEGGIVTTLAGALLPLQPVSVDTAGPVTVRDYGIVGFEVPSAAEVLEFLSDRGWSPTFLIVDAIPAGEGLSVWGHSIRTWEKHYAVVHHPDDPSGGARVLYLWHELCHEALDSSDEDEVNACAWEYLAAKGREAWEHEHPGTTTVQQEQCCTLPGVAGNWPRGYYCLGGEGGIAFCARHSAYGVRGCDGGLLPGRTSFWVGCVPAEGCQECGPNSTCYHCDTWLYPCGGCWGTLAIGPVRLGVSQSPGPFLSP